MSPRVVSPRIETFDCPRCNKTHEQRFKPLSRPAGPWTHWGMCRETREPVLMMEKPIGVWGFVRRMGETGLFKVKAS